MLDQAIQAHDKKQTRQLATLSDGLHAELRVQLASDLAHAARDAHAAQEDLLEQATQKLHTEIALLGTVVAQKTQADRCTSAPPMATAVQFMVA